MTKTIKQTKKYKNYKTLNTIVESVDSTVIITATSTSIIPWVICIGLIDLPLSAGVACTLSPDNKILHRFIVHKCIKYIKQNEKINKQ